MPAPEYPVRCFICGELTEPFDPSGDQVGAQLVGEDRIVFFAHHECMRRVASPDFPFPSQEDLDEQARELVESWRAELEEEAEEAE